MPDDYEIHKLKEVAPGAALVIVNKTVSVVELRSRLREYNEIRRLTNKLEHAKSLAKEQAYVEILSMVCEFPKSGTWLQEKLREHIAHERKYRDTMP